MVLALAVHTVEEVSARIPFCMMVLNEVLGRQTTSSSVPPGLHNRFLIPTSGTVSISVWDAPDLETLKQWLDETLSEYCETECYEAVEEFSQGIAVELARGRVSESVSQKTGAAAATVGEKAQVALNATAAKAREAGQKVGQRFDEIDQKLKLKEKTAKVGTTVGSTTRSVVGKAGNLAQQTKDRAMQNKVVASGVQQIGSGVKVGTKAIGSGLSFLTSKIAQLGDTVIKSVQELDAEEKRERAADEMREEMLKEALEEAESDGNGGGGEEGPEKKEEEYFAGFDDDDDGGEEAEAAPSVEEKVAEEAPAPVEEAAPAPAAPAPAEEAAPVPVAPAPVEAPVEEKEETPAPVPAVPAAVSPAEGA